MKWKCECGECQLSAEQQERLNQFTRDELLSIIPELVCNNPRATSVLKNKWLTAPHDILCKVKAEYEERTREPLDFCDTKTISAWMDDLYYAVLAPLDRTIPVLPYQSEEIILFFISDWRRLYEKIIPTGDDDSWHNYLMIFWLKAIYESANGDINYITTKIDNTKKIAHMSITLASIVYSIHRLPKGTLKDDLIKQYDTRLLNSQE